MVIMLINNINFKCTLNVVPEKQYNFTLHIFQIEKIKYAFIMNNNNSVTIKN